MRDWIVSFKLVSEKIFFVDMMASGRARGVLYELLALKMGEKKVYTTAASIVPTKTVTMTATTLSRAHKKITIPQTKRKSATCSKTGNKLMIAGM